MFYVFVLLVLLRFDFVMFLLLLVACHFFCVLDVFLCAWYLLIFFCRIGCCLFGVALYVVFIFLFFIIILYVDVRLFCRIGCFYIFVVSVCKYLIN